MKKYNILQHPTRFRDFQELLPRIDGGQGYYFELLCRVKYLDTPVEGLKNGTLRRFTTNLERMEDKIRQLEAPLGSYKVNGVEVPQEALVLYMHPNPRDLDQALKNLMVRLSEMVSKGTTGNPQTLAMSEIAKAKANAYSTFVDFDFDGVTLPYVIDKTRKAVNPEAVIFIKTLNGVHTLVDLSKVEERFAKTFYRNLVSIEGCDKASGNMMIPVVGTVQGSSSPHFYTDEWIVWGKQQA